MAYHIRVPRVNAAPVRELKAHKRALTAQVNAVKRELSPSSNDGIVWLSRATTRAAAHVNRPTGLLGMCTRAFQGGYNRGRYGRYGRRYAR